MAKETNLLSHWSQLVEAFQASPLAFYEALSLSIQTRMVPELTESRSAFKESGAVSASREYLRIVRGKYAFDICASPFGTGFFFSWWLTEIKGRFGWLYLVGFLFAAAFAMIILFAMSSPVLGFFTGIFVSTFGIAALGFGFGYLVREGQIGMEEIVLTTPLVGVLYEHVFSPPTFYNLDSALMFQQAVHNAVLEVIDGMMSANGLRALSDVERKPVLKAFAKSA